MTDTATTTPPAAPPAATSAASATAPAEGEQEEGGAWGRVMDGVGIAAGAVLAVILIDIFTDGRFISRRLGWRRDDGDQAPAEAPPEPAT